MTTSTVTQDPRRSPEPAGSPRRLRSPRRALQVAVSATALLVLLAVVLPKVTGASWESALRALSFVSPWQLVGLTTLWLVGLWAYSFVLAASLPGLSKGQGFVLNLVGSGVSNLVPFGGAVGVGVTWTMARQYGFSHRSIGLFTAVTGVWNIVARLALPVAGLAGLLVVGAHVNGPLMVAAGVGAGVCALVIVLIAVALVSDRAAERVIRGATAVCSGVARLLHRPAPHGLELELAAQRQNAVSLLRANRGGLVLGMLAYLVLQGVLMWACLAVVGSDLGIAEVAAGYACGRMLTIVVLTPGGTGFAETGAAAVLIALGGDPAVTMAGVLLFSFFTYVCEIPGAALAYAWHQGARHWHRQRAEA
jgi:uncharacterized membrane protein YbhN (UPF0104 family)